ncbi:MAG: aminotransferase class III-fold pyridoxal phosphate-dependent enzyme [Armatimonadetes bacterium]|nr:aminotransferase class III-fold pyridoxal phosphate-dependent enzyme [Armatimonadota bacterium]
MRPETRDLRLETRDPEAHANEVAELYIKHLNPGWATVVKFMGYGVVETEAEGCWITDSASDRWLDCLGGPGVFTMGHRHPAVVEAVERQLHAMPLSSHLLLNEKMAQLAAALADLCPGDLQHAFICNSGAEAVEGALKIARAYTGRPKFVGALGGFHGKTFGALSASGREQYKTPFEPLLPGFSHVPFGDRDALAAAVDNETAAVVLEPVQCEAGIIIPPEDYLPAVREICDRAGALLILDEIQSGLCRTGKTFACEWWDVTPDLMCLGKALGGGVMPIGAFVGSDDAWSVFHDNPLIHTSTFGGNPLACAAALAALKLVREGGLCEAALERGSQLLAGLSAIGADYPDLIREVRGKGLLVGVEFADADVGGLAIAALAQRRILCAYGLNDPHTLRFEPPAVITEAEVDHVCAMLREAVDQAKMLMGLASEA